MTRPRSVINVSLPIPGETYDRSNETQARLLISQAIAGCLPVQQKQTVTGSRGGNVALASLITAFVNLGFLVDATTV